MIEEFGAALTKGIFRRHATEKNAKHPKKMLSKQCIEKLPNFSRQHGSDGIQVWHKICVLVECQKLYKVSTRFPQGLLPNYVEKLRITVDEWMQRIKAKTRRESTIKKNAALTMRRCTNENAALRS